jgi:hypothetical protein
MGKDNKDGKPSGQELRLLEKKSNLKQDIELSQGLLDRLEQDRKSANDNSTRRRISEDYEQQRRFIRANEETLKSIDKDLKEVQGSRYDPNQKLPPPRKRPNTAKRDSLAENSSSITATSLNKNSNNSNGLNNTTSPQTQSCII